ARSEGSSSAISSKTSRIFSGLSFAIHITFAVGWTAISRVRILTQTTAMKSPPKKKFALMSRFSLLVRFWKRVRKSKLVRVPNCSKIQKGAALNVSKDSADQF
ncbi:MAG: hypothetical protein KA368_18195, partial [Acidobacteria bacterium]|nr:hypothetical protein [Acidobacteriota bacterium]